jgi:hypothetical protein
MLESNLSAAPATVSWADPCGLPTFDSAQLMVLKAINSPLDVAKR